METELLNIEKVSPEEKAAALKKAGEIIREGGLVAFPTETVYGLGADALNAEASAKIYAAKGRPSDNPLIVHIPVTAGSIFTLGSTSSNISFVIYPGLKIVGVSVLISIIVDSIPIPTAPPSRINGILPCISSYT